MGNLAVVSRYGQLRKERQRRGGECALFEELYRTSPIEGVAGWVGPCLSGLEERKLTVTLWSECATGRCRVSEKTTSNIFKQLEKVSRLQILTLQRC